MRTLRASLASLLVASIAACGAKPAPVESPGNAGGGGAPAGKEHPAGTTGFPGLDWGDGVDELTALFPGAERNDGGLAWQGDVERRLAGVQFILDGDGLQQIDIGWAEVFASMEACGDDLHLTRPAIDARLGQGDEENLGVFWETPTASVVLVCDPGDDGSALLQARYTRKVGE